MLNAGMDVDTVMHGMEEELMGPVVMAVIESAVVLNVSANDLLRNMGMSHMTEEETQRFGYSGESRTSDGLLPPASSANALSRYLCSIIPGPLQQSVVDRADAHSPAEQTMIWRGIGRLRTGTPPSVLASEPGSDLLGSLIALLQCWCVTRNIDELIPMLWSSASILPEHLNADVPSVATTHTAPHGSLQLTLD